MCGRFSYWDSETIKHYYDCHADFSVAIHYNACPNQHIPVILAEIHSTSSYSSNPNTDSQSTTIKRILEPMRWGLIPDWAKNDTHRGFINARSETITQKKSFKENFLLRRCIIPARGFYEWDENKQPHFISLPQKHIAFAGIWDGGNNGMFPSVAIITQASDKLEHIHERMPIILETEQDISTWLHPTSHPHTLEEIISHTNDKNYISYPVNKNVSNPKNNYESLIDAI